jgi:NhaP-type Na+/H+ or K+/H+ antiporter
MTLPNDPAVVLSFIIAAGIAAQWLAARFRFPSILPLLLIGFIAGPISGLLNPDAVFGDLLLPGVQLGVAVILFEGALTLRFADLKGAGNIVLRLITIGVLTTVLVIAIATHIALDFPWSLAILFGAITCVSGPTVIIPLLRAVRPSERLSKVLHWEGILIDAIGAVLAVVVFEVIVSGSMENASPILSLAKVFILWGLVGVIAGFLVGQMLKRHILPDFLRNVATLSAVLLTFVLANMIGHEGGLVAVTTMGLMMANMKGMPRDGILDFKESLSVLLISSLFIVLAARIELESLALLGPGLVVILLAILFIARPLAALVSSLGSDMPWRERALLGWMAPRGIVAAAVSALFGLRLENAGISGGELLVPLTFSVIVVTVVVHSLTSRPLARILKVAEPEAHGVLIVGGNLVAVKIAEILKNNQIKVLLADPNWLQARRARMLGIPTFFGSAVSEYADRKMDLVGLGMLLALSRRSSLNALACLRYRQEFGSANVYTARRNPKNIDREQETVSFSFRGRLLFKEGMTLDRLEDELEQGRKIHLTRISEDFPFDALLKKLGGTDPMLFALSPQGKLHPFAEEPGFTITKGWKVAYLAAEDTKVAEQDERDGKRSNDWPAEPNGSEAPA